MGLYASIYRDSDCKGDCTNGGMSSKVTRVTIVNCDGPFEPCDDAPAAHLESHVAGCVRLRFEQDKGKQVMMGGNFVHTCDSRFRQKIEKLLGHSFYGAVAIHDRVE